MATATDALMRSGAMTDAFRDRWAWLLALGIIQIIAGVAALLVPAIASFVALGVFAAILLIAAVFHLIHAFKVRRWSGFALHLLGGLLYGAAGVIVLFDPLNGVATLMLVIGVLFIVDGSVRAMLASTLRPRDGWGWFLAAGLMSIALGVMLLVMWPAAALWVVGTLFGINLLFSGATSIGLALQCRASRAVSVAPESDDPALA
jgi:uncharacterized membrane protein HdeD (DUF308 family)